MVCGLDVPTLKNVRLSLQTLELLSFPPSRIRFLLNRANSKVGLKRREVEAALGVKIGAEVPSERSVPLGVNRGSPAVLSNPGCDFSKAVRELATSLFPAPAKARGRRVLPAFARA
jgi:pilus assembly protein CpaE